jgi:hypothetical protein
MVAFCKRVQGDLQLMNRNVTVYYWAFTYLHLGTACLLP